MKVKIATARFDTEQGTIWLLTEEDTVIAVIEVTATTVEVMLPKGTELKVLTLGEAPKLS
jgi:hypothetical protein